ncbi:tRNA (adenosine(37)-N6)-threonylcarbamoyltransferase complex ATPase subunit type 1 TsaE [Nocardioides yefusunii]|uniref:tRNA threonylcarbamoyladenosine biosynthesis protein TsaE n=1 Tax=Nocardioides yefusunii TaxID=2500546 RepID=A0ABW1QXZ2_9ACTN|nr:tRNA (adenosine(37)-N6)-threonylcarbamoyltransferase complex ATPase subunit type 1 TsaE [Nocardioides yefusunii]
MLTRRVGAEAAAEVHACILAAFASRPPLDPPTAALGDSDAEVAAMLGRANGIVAVQDGRIVGSLILDVRDDVVHLRRVSVRPDAQGHGVASTLVQAAVEACPAQRTMVVLAREEIASNVVFWEHHGFVEHSRTSPHVELHLALPERHVVTDAYAMRDLGENVGRLLERGDLLVLTGGLGAGKTTFTQGLGEGLQVRSGITSPTFVIARVHPSLVDGPALVHVDAYRLGGVDELDDLDLDTSFDDAVTVVEWGAGVAEGLADRRLEVTVTRAVGEMDIAETAAQDDADAAADVEGLEDLDPRVVTLTWVRSA